MSIWLLQVSKPASLSATQPHPRENGSIMHCFQLDFLFFALWMKNYKMYFNEQNSFQLKQEGWVKMSKCNWNNKERKKETTKITTKKQTKIKNNFSWPPLFDQHTCIYSVFHYPHDHLFEQKKQKTTTTLKARHCGKYLISCLATPITPAT